MKINAFQTATSENHRTTIHGYFIDEHIQHTIYRIKEYPSTAFNSPAIGHPFNTWKMFK